MAFSTSDLIQQIRRYQSRPENRELLRSHHFVFDCPLDPDYREKPDYLWFGINPGGDDADWERLPCNAEETRDYDFQVEYGRSSASSKRLDNVRDFLGTARFQLTSHCELFFWCSRNTGKAFRERYGYAFNGNPHEHFCWRVNMELIERVRPKAIFAEKRAYLSLWDGRCDLMDRRTHSGPNGTVLLEEARMLGGWTAFYCFDHLSALGQSIANRPLLKQKVRERLLVHESEINRKSYDKTGRSAGSTARDSG